LKKNTLIKAVIILALLINLPVLLGIIFSSQEHALTRISFYLGLLVLISSAILWKFFQIKQRSILIYLLFSGIIMLVSPAFDFIPKVWTFSCVTLLLSLLVFQKFFRVHILVILFIIGLTTLLLPLNFRMILGFMIALMR
jgi:hypothetical protein